MSYQLVRDARVACCATLEERVRNTIGQLCVLTREATLDFTLSVGKVVVDTLYAGDLSAWRSRARKDHALRVLAASPDLPFSASALFRALGIYELSQRHARPWQHLGVSHLRTVVGLPIETQNQLLSAAEHERWTVVKLEREVIRVRTSRRTNGGRKPLPQYVKTIRRIFELTLPEALNGLESLDELDASAIEELAGKLAKTQERLCRLAKVLTSGASVVRSGRPPMLMQSREAYAFEN